MYECGVSVPDDKRLFKLVSMSGALEELEARQMVLSQILFSHSLERNICLEDVILRAAQMEQIVEKVRIQSPFQVIVHHSLHIIKFLPIKPQNVTLKL
ncbi:hypothetical protein HID58_069375 [Brassica napus]|uniref:Uncharacterized protein n=1 Tax=Brassica napus TaxID=3708 RepID=A0ABQ7YVU5_BRANA|nr:hypothetical protein HID58_069375 [Brassica napus]